MERLDKQMLWESLYNRVFKQIQSKFKQREIPVFKKWFMERECLGYCFDSVLIYRCFHIWKELKNDLDHFICIVGREGLGKSTLAVQIAAWVNPNFIIDNICYGTEAYLDLMYKKVLQIKSSDHTKLESESLIMDEGTELLSRESMQLSNRTLLKTFFVQRALKYLVIINIPSFFMLDTVVRQHRTRTLIEIQSRGHYKCMTGKAIKLVSEFGVKTKSIASVKLSSGSFWHGDFNKGFPKTIDYNTYHKLKRDGIKILLEELKEDIVTKKLIAVSKVVKEIDISRMTIINQIKEGKIKGKQVGSKWFITNEEFQKMANV